MTTVFHVGLCTSLSQINLFDPKNIASGEYLHFGIEKSINRFNLDILYSLSEMVCDFNIDGLPLYKSSRTTVWPILGSFSDCRSLPPFMVGVWTGQGHPSSADLFLKDFSDEIISLKRNGILISQSGERKSFTLRAIICDAPAKSFCKSVLNHNSKKGCHECSQIGFRFLNTPVYNVESGILRTDESFTNRVDAGHHHSLIPNVLEKCGIKMVTQFPLDPMHLVDLGITKKILILSLDKFNTDTKKLLSETYASYSKFVPCEFARKPRDFSEIPRWKATEFRFFILYGFIPLFKKFLDSNTFYHFLSISIA